MPTGLAQASLTGLETRTGKRTSRQTPDMAETGLAARTGRREMGRCCTAATAGHRDASAQQEAGLWWWWNAKTGRCRTRWPVPLAKRNTRYPPLAAWAALSVFLQAGEKPEGLLLSMK